MAKTVEGGFEAESRKTGKEAGLLYRPDGTQIKGVREVGGLTFSRSQLEAARGGAVIHYHPPVTYPSGVTVQHHPPSSLDIAKIIIYDLTIYASDPDYRYVVKLKPGVELPKDSTARAELASKMHADWIKQWHEHKAEYQKSLARKKISDARMQQLLQEAQGEHQHKACVDIAKKYHLIYRREKRT